MVCYRYRLRVVNLALYLQLIGTSRILRAENAHGQQKGDGANLAVQQCLLELLDAFVGPFR